MKAVVQRVCEASVSVDGKIISSIEKGILVFLGIHKNDSDETIEWMCDKLVKLRIFRDAEGKMNYSVEDIEGGILVISQFTLYGNLKKGTRPGYIEAAPADIAHDIYEQFLKTLSRKYRKVSDGVFGADMKVNLLNDGPVTILLER